MNEFIAEDDISKEILNSAKLLQTVELHALIVGERGVGKKALAKFILPKSKIFDSKSLQKDIQDNILNIENESIIVDKIDELTNISSFLKWIEDKKVRIIGICKNNNLNKNLKDIFSINLEIPNLLSRKKDTSLLIKRISKKASLNLSTPYIDIDYSSMSDYTNTYDIKKAIYFFYLDKNIGQKELMNYLEKYFLDNMTKESSFKELLSIFEIPLLRAYNKTYKSQVQVAKKLGLNRITLRKKLDLYKDFLN